MRARLCEFLGALAATALAALLAGNAQAQSPFAASRGFYIAGEGGASFLRSIDFSIPQSSSNKATFKTGWAALGSGGYAFDNGFRTEVEGSYRRNSIDKFRQLDGSGNLSATAVMLNGFYDWNINNGPIVPYIGGGAGWVWVRANNIKRNLISCCPQIDGRDSAFGYQAIIGASWHFSPQFSVNLDYRFLGTTKLTLDAESGGVGTSARGHYYDHAVMLGLRWTFPK